MTEHPKRTETPVQLIVSNRQRRIPVDVSGLQKFGHRALQACRETAASRKMTAEEVTVLIISDRRMAQLHKRFMDIAGPTDVITFHHGEIFISAETAQRNADRFRSSFGRELQLYLVHGLLHLHGFDDRTPAQSRRMHLLQSRIVRKASPPKSRPRGV